MSGEKKRKGTSAYVELLKDPRWQKKRLEILQRDDWMCGMCEADDKTLHVHHKRYQWGKKPWEYDADLLMTLCADCHEATTLMTKRVQEALGNVSPHDLTRVLGFLHGLYLQTWEAAVDRASLKLEDAEHAGGVAASYGVDEFDLLHEASARDYIVNDEWMSELRSRAVDERHAARKARNP